LRFSTARPHLQGLESHLALMIKQIGDFNPAAVVVDPVTNLTEIGSDREAKTMLVRLVDFLKSRRVTAVFTSLTADQHNLEKTEVGISSLMDTWLLLRNIESNGERNRGLYVLKSRGTAHSNQIREFNLTNHGAQLSDVYTGVAGVLTGTARIAQEARERADILAHQQEIERKRRQLESKKKAMEAQIAALHAAIAAESLEFEKIMKQTRIADDLMNETRAKLGSLRGNNHGRESGNRRRGENYGRSRPKSGEKTDG